LISQIQNLFDKFRKILALNDLHKKTHDIRERYLIYKDNLTEYELKSNETVAKFLDIKRSFGGPLLQSLEEIVTESMRQFRELTGIQRSLRKTTVLAIILSAFAMAAGIAALLFGWWFWDLSLGLVWGIMIGEFIIACLALTWTVHAAIKMLKDPIADETLKALDGYFNAVNLSSERS